MSDNWNCTEETTKRLAVVTVEQQNNTDVEILTNSFK